MKIAVIGATGMAGSRITSEALQRGHHVIGISRTGLPKGLQHPNLTSMQADATDPNAMSEIAHTSDVIVLATRPAAGQEDTVTETTVTVLDACREANRRVIIIGGAGPLASPDDPNQMVIDDPRYVAPEWRAIAQASVTQLRACKRHQADWTYVSPPAQLQPGTRTGTYRRGTIHVLVDEDGRSRISAEDLAVAVLDDIEVPRQQGRHFTVAY